MKSETEIQNACDRVNRGPSAYPGMTYEDGIRDALDWILGNVEDGDFIDDPKLFHEQ